MQELKTENYEIDGIYFFQKALVINYLFNKPNWASVAKTVKKVYIIIAN